MNKKQIEGWLTVWIFIGLFICLFSTIVFADALDLGIRGKQLFNSEEIIDMDFVDTRYRESIQRSIDSINKNFGGDPWIQSERFDFIVLPNLANVGVLLSLAIFSSLSILWVYVGRKLLSKFCNCKFNFVGDVIEIEGISCKEIGR